MKAIENYGIKGNDGRLINSILWKNTDYESDKTAVIFPGYRYPSEAPLNFYLKILFDKYGYDVFSIDYRYNENITFQSLNDVEKEEYFESDQKNIFHYINNRFKDKKIVFIGKSLGTSAIFHIVRNNLDERIIKNSIFLWLTPSENNLKIIEMCNEYNLKSFYVIGNNDPFFDRKILESINKETFKRLIIEDAGHLMEKNKDLKASIDNVKEVILWIEENIRLKMMGL